METQAGSTPFLTLGTRGSPLALIQAEQTRRLLAEHHGIAEDEIAVMPITTAGDTIQDRPLSEVGGKGLFTKQIEQALADGAIDIAVHSAKDVETELPAGLGIAVCLEREDARDALISASGKPLAELPEAVTIGTSSIRRAAQMRRARPDVAIVPFRGNVGTRLRKLAEGQADATLLAAAGLNRLGQGDAATELLDPEVFVPAPGQGVVCLEIRETDRRTAGLIAPLNHPRTAIEFAAERAFLDGLDGSCRTPIGALSQWPEAGRLRLTGEVLSPDGAVHHHAALEGPPDQAVALGHELAELLRAEAGTGFFAELERRG